MRDFVLRGVLLYGERVVDAAVSDGKWVAISDGLGSGFGDEIDGSGRILLPGVVDAHVHFNEPGRTGWEGISTGSAALAAGGGTAFFDMPLNSFPPVLDAAGVLEKRRLCEEKSLTDFAIWGGLTPNSLKTMEEMADQGVIAFKAFMCGSGLEEFGKAGRRVLGEGMKIAARRGLTVGVHAEDETVIAGSGVSMAVTSIPEGMRRWFASRPVEAELAAIRIAMDLAGEAGAKLHVVHVTHPDCLDLISRGRAGGVDVTAETCPHYLVLNEDSGAVIGASAKCAPPLRDKKTVDALWGSLGLVDTIGSDHSPSPPEMKTGNDVFEMWGGIAGCQNGIELVCNRSLTNGFPLEILSRKWRENVFRRFDLVGAGINVGADADFFLLEKDGAVITEGEQLSKHRFSPYVGMEREWCVSGTWLRGERVASKTRGRFLRPGI